jgi:hypothetical protein
VGCALISKVFALDIKGKIILSNIGNVVEEGDRRNGQEKAGDPTVRTRGIREGFLKRKF